MPVVLAANKAEGKAGTDGLMEAYALGFGEPVGLSAQHGEGMAELYQAIRETLGEDAFEAAMLEEDDEGSEGFNEGVLERLEAIDVDNPDLSEEALNSALQEAGIDDAAEETAAAEARASAASKPIRLAIVGRPNAGKSTLINQLLQSDRLLTGPEAGITRDSVTVKWTWKTGKSDWLTQQACASGRKFRNAWKRCRQVKPSGR